MTAQSQHSKTIALAIDLDLPTDLISFDHNKYPGSGWIKEFIKLANLNSFNVVKAEDLPADSENVFLVQEDMCKKGAHLFRATKSITFCLESVIYSPTWYKQKDKLGFKSVLEFGSPGFHFPSFEPSEVVQNPTPRSKNLCMIISNKHYSRFGIIPPISQLHDYRYQVIEWAKTHHDLDLYGMGWGDYAPPTQDKLETLKEYKSTIIIENDARYGYFTEKFVHAMVAGCMPIYYGDPKASTFLSANPADIENSILTATLDSTYDEFLDFRDRWLVKEAPKYTYECFARKIFSHVG